jgi:hypothetical protein
MNRQAIDAQIMRLEAALNRPSRVRGVLVNRPANEHQLTAQIANLRRLREQYSDRVNQLREKHTLGQNVTVADQIKAIIRNSNGVVTIYSLAKNMGCSESEKQRLKRYLKGNGKSLPTGGVKRIVSALSELCREEISIHE